MQRSSLFPYTTLFRSSRVGRQAARAGAVGVGGVDVVVVQGPHVAAGVIGTRRARRAGVPAASRLLPRLRVGPDRKSTRLNSSHANNSYAVLCLKNKKT